MQAKKPKNGVKIKPKSKEHYVNSKEFKEAIKQVKRIASLRLKELNNRGL